MQDKNYLIVGGSSGIGLNIVQQLATTKCERITVISRNNQALQQLKGISNVTHIQADIIKDEIFRRTITRSHSWVWCIAQAVSILRQFQVIKSGRFPGRLRYQCSGRSQECSSPLKKHLKKVRPIQYYFIQHGCSRPGNAIPFFHCSC